MSLSLHTAPTLLPVSLEEARTVQHVDESDEDYLLELAINQATEDAEQIMKRAISPQKWQLTLYAFDGVLTLQRPKVTAVDSVKYVNTEGVLNTLDPSAYKLSASSDYTATLHPAYGTSWPSTRAEPEAVQVVFTCGDANVAAVPASIKAWILLRVGALFEFRSAWTLGKKIETNPHLDHLLDRYKVITF